MERYKTTPGNNPASKRPSRSLQTIRPAKFVTKAENVATRPQQNIRPPRYRAGFILLMIILDGVSKIFDFISLQLATSGRSRTYDIGNEKNRDRNLELSGAYV
jgi:hypothetical protein